MPFFSPIRPLSRLLGTLVLAALLLAPAGASLAQGPSISPRAHEALTQIQSLLQESKWREADAALGRFIENFSRESYAVATAWQMRGYLLSETGRNAEALKAYETALQSDDLDAASAQQIRYNIAQILMSLGRHAEALRAIDAWLAAADDITPERRVQAAWIHLGAESYKRAARLMEEALRAAPAPPESWYQLLVAALQGAQDNAALVKWLPVVIERFPQEKRYWQQLSSVYFQLQDDRRAVAALAAAYHNGLMTQERDILHLARFHLYVGVPHKAARILEEALEKRRIEASAAHYELLADSWLRAQELPFAVTALHKALTAGAGYETSLKLGQIHLQQEEWDAAVEPLRRAAQSPRERTRADALLMLGMASFYSGDAVSARTAFVQARDHSSARRQAESWLAFLDTDPAPGS